MSNKDGMKALQAFVALKQKADAGNPNAQAELQKLRTAFAGMAKFSATPSGVSAAAIEEAVYDGDALDDAEFIAQKMEGTDDLVRKSMLRKQTWANLDHVAPFVRSNVPPSVLAGTLGGQQTPTNATPIIQVANWAGLGNEETTSIGILACPVQQIDQQFVNQAFRPFLRATFGTRGFSVALEADIGRGCQFNVSGAACTLEVGVEIGDNEYQTAGDMILAGMLSFSPVPPSTDHRITRTKYTGVLNAPGAEIVTVPPFAKSVVLTRAPLTAACDFLFTDQNGVLLYELDLAGNQVFFDPIQLSNDVVAIQIQTAGAQIARTRMIFNLAI
jgi:hypothetical protein